MSPLYRILSLAAASALLAACATVPQPLQGNYATNVTSLGAQQGSANGTAVRWGGEIISTEPGQQSTCFYVLGHPLDDQARPTRSTSNDSQGRFVACRAGFYDPEVFARGREITVTGTVQGTMSRKVGDYDYAYPRVEANVVYLWPKRPMVVNYPYGPGWYDPFWGPYWGGPYWGGWGGFYGPPVIVVRHR
ncbi:Slp family lipoprotein [Dyella lipolytica]|uniref:Slp family lipoprotein n=1 Tax=Dyella lipolytica TaxID=1867835 RepID=A0ABW8IZE0_9GAMM|nr:Slp family lipoprotein [Dyella lipolytica]